VLPLWTGLSVCALWVQADTPKTSPAKRPSVEEIKRAVEELGNKRFAVREKAKRLLEEAGAAAEPFLEEASTNPDNEIAESARTILEKFQWGLYPDTPQALRDLIEQFRAGTPEQRLATMHTLITMKPAPYATIRRLLAKESKSEDLPQFVQLIHANTRESAPRLLNAGEYDTLEAFLELTAAAMPSQAANDYAVLTWLRGKTDEAIKRFEKVRAGKGEAAKRAAEVLVYLYRTKGNWALARKAAEDAKGEDGKGEDLVERVLWQASDWKALAANPARPDTAVNVWGVNAAYDRLAGNTKAFNEKIEEILKVADDETEGSVRSDADALLLNGKASEAIKILIDKKKEMGLTFELLCAQMKHKEAFALVDEARRRDAMKIDDPLKQAEKNFERGQIGIQRARTLYLLGEKEAATQLFGQLADDFKKWQTIPKDENAEPDININQFEILARTLVKAQTRVGLRDHAANNAAGAIDLLQKGQTGINVSAFFEALFGEQKSAASVWWNFFRANAPDEKPAVAMKRVRDILAGKLDPDKGKAKKLLDEWAAKWEKAAASNPDPQQPRGRGRGHARLHAYPAIAAAYRALGDEAKTENYLRQAAEKGNTRDRWTALGDFLMSLKKYKPAIEAFAKAAKAKSRAENANNEAGEEDYENLFMEDAGPALPTYLQGRALIADGDAKEGKRLVELAHWLPLGDERARAKLVEELNKREWPEMARKEAQMLVSTGWYHEYSFGNVLSFLARQASKERDFFKAADYYEKCVVGCLRTGASFVEPTAYLVVPESIRSYRARGLIAKGKIDEGLKEAAASLEVMPGNIDLVIKLVPELEKAGKKKEAEALYVQVRDVYEKLSKDYPGSAFARNSVAWVMANCRRDLDEALKYAAKAVELEPRNAGYLDTLAEVNFRKGNRDKALELMKKCVELDQKNGYFKRQLARFKDQPFDSSTPEEEEDDE